MLSEKRFIAAGYQYSMFLVNGEVFGFGANSKGELGIGTNESKKTLQKCVFPNPNEKITNMFCSKGHVNYFITRSNKILGNGEVSPDLVFESSNFPVKIPKIQKRITQIRSIYTYYNTFFLFKSGVVEVVGNHNSDGEQGTNIPHSNRLTTIKFPHKDTKIMSIAPGGCHTLFLDNKSRVFSTGWNSHSQLALGHRNERKKPTHVTFFKDFEVESIAAGRYHSVFVKFDGSVFSCGDNNFIHTKNLIHRDLKPKNLLITETYQTKLTDFGLSRIYENDISVKKTKRIGTMFYMSPEVFTSGRYTESIDIFSFGMVCFTVITEKFGNPYDATDRTIGAVDIRAAADPDFRPKINADYFKDCEWCMDLITRCWSGTPNERPSGKEILELFNEKGVKDSIDIERIKEREKNSMLQSTKTEGEMVNKKLFDFEDMMDNLRNVVLNQNINDEQKVKQLTKLLKSKEYGGSDDGMDGGNTLMQQQENVQNPILTNVIDMLGVDMNNIEQNTSTQQNVQEPIIDHNQNEMNKERDQIEENDLNNDMEKKSETEGDESTSILYQQEEIKHTRRKTILM